MPLYEYCCKDCGETFEVIQKFAEDPLETCESCGGRLERLVSAPAIQFKGTGWYVTDYARKNGQNGSSKRATEKSATETKATTAGSGSETTKSS